MSYHCAVCRTALDDALILVCNHNVCLDCAASEAAGGSSVHCRVCKSETVLESEASAQLHSIFLRNNKQIKQQHKAPVAAAMPSAVSVKGRSAQSNPELVKSDEAATRTKPDGKQNHPIASKVPTIASKASTVVPESDRCEHCQDTNARATVQCTQCDDSYCENCASAFHSRGKMSKHVLTSRTEGQGAHGVQAAHKAPVDLPSPVSVKSVAQSTRMALDSSVLGPLDESHDVRCPNHPGESLKYFCLVCDDRPVCSECVFRSDQHVSHLKDVIMIKNANSELRNRIAGQASMIDSLVRDAEYCSRDVSRLMQQVDKAASDTVNSVQAIFAAARTRLENRESEIIRDIHNFVSPHKASISATKSTVGEIQQEIAAMGKLSPSNYQTREFNVQSLVTYCKIKDLCKSLKDAASRMSETPVMEVSLESLAVLRASAASLNSLVDDIAVPLPTVLSHRGEHAAREGRSNARHAHETESSSGRDTLGHRLDAYRQLELRSSKETVAITRKNNRDNVDIPSKGGSPSAFRMPPVSQFADFERPSSPSRQNNTSISRDSGLVTGPEDAAFLSSQYAGIVNSLNTFNHRS